FLLFALAGHRENLSKKKKQSSVFRLFGKPRRTTGLFPPIFTIAKTYRGIKTTIKHGGVYKKIKKKNPPDKHLPPP
ncbi:hypothetical protein, partial [Candidatus Proelusimicrobium volucris]|uniref:hypothetical protein n=1 Tax=Candidatus Proelusimicrobium volucris TaxID=3416225 RepID=UPI003D0F323B